MNTINGAWLALALWSFSLSAAPPPPAQSSGTAGTLSGTVSDPSGGVIPGATVQLSNPQTGFKRSVQTDASGGFRFNNIPGNPYHLEVSAAGFQTAQQDVAVRSTVPLTLPVTLSLAGETTSVEVHSAADEVVENIPTAHTDLDSELFSKLPRTSTGSGLSDALTLATPGVVADSNGFFHPLGDHAQTGFSIDNQPVTDQQSKQFSTQLPLAAIQSMEAIFGAAPAEFGDKTSLVVNVTTKSGLGSARPFGSFSTSYGSFGTVQQSATLGFGAKQLGNFLAVETGRSGRFLDTPEFTPLHAVGNNQQVFDRFDWQPDSNDTFRLNLGFGRSWFQIPNTWDQQLSGQDQRQLIRSFNISPGWIRILGPSAVFTLTPYFRHDQVNYFPSRDVLADLPATASLDRRLTNTGVRADVSYAKGIHNAKTGIQYSRTMLRERFGLGITDPSLNPVCLNPDGDPAGAPSIVNPASCGTAGLVANPNLQPGLLPYDLTRGGSPFQFRGSANIDQFAAFIQDTITLGHLALNLGLRGETYQGISSANSVQPRAGLSYQIKTTGTVLRVSYSRFFETPYNENLVLSSSTGVGGLASNVFGAFGAKALEPGRRRQYNAGFQQALGKHVVVDAEYFWKFTRNAYDFDTLFNSPIQFPIEWRKSKIDGLTARISLIHFNGFTAYTSIGHTRARFFGPESGGILFNSPVDASVFRIDHDQAFEQTTSLRYQPKKDQWWLGFTWRYDSGMASGRVEDFDMALNDLTGAQQSAIGLTCGGLAATPFAPIRSCGGALAASRLRIPAGGTFNADTNPTRIAGRNLFDLSVGNDNLLKGDRYRITLQASAVNLSNEAALYNFLSTFSGTHFVSPRALRFELGFVF